MAGFRGFKLMEMNEPQRLFSRRFVFVNVKPFTGNSRVCCSPLWGFAEGLLARELHAQGTDRTTAIHCGGRETGGKDGMDGWMKTR